MILEPSLVSIELRGRNLKEGKGTQRGGQRKDGGVSSLVPSNISPSLLPSLARRREGTTHQRETNSPTYDLDVVSISHLVAISEGEKVGRRVERGGGEEEEE